MLNLTLTLTLSGDTIFLNISDKEVFLTEYYSISDLAKELDITTRTIRYYEEMGLLHPERTSGGVRRFTRSDRARLKLILRGKRFGFSLEEIRELIDLFSADRTGKKQIMKTLEYGRKKIAIIEERIAELHQLKLELEEWEERLRSKIENGED